MISWLSILLLVHLVGLAWGVGGATVKVVLLLRCKADPAFASTYFKIAKPITRQIVLGVVLLASSGGGWLILGYPFTTPLIVKLVLVAGILLLGSIIDNVVEPKFQRLAPAAGEPPSPGFVQVQKQHFALEILATLLFYAIVVIWVVR